MPVLLIQMASEPLHALPEALQWLPPTTNSRLPAIGGGELLEFETLLLASRGKPRPMAHFRWATARQELAKKSRTGASKSLKKNFARGANTFWFPLQGTHLARPGQSPHPLPKIWLVRRGTIIEFQCKIADIDFPICFTNNDGVGYAEDLVMFCLTSGYKT